MVIKRIRILIFCSFILLLELSTALAIEGTASITTNNYANKELQYYYYIPSEISKNPQKASPLLVMVPGLSGKGEYFVNQQCKDFAEKEKFIIIAPSFTFDEKNWKAKKSYHYPSVWSGQALLKIVHDFKAKHGLNISKFYLIGHSAGAQFVLRFALWKPQLCAAIAGHGSGGWIRPKRYVPGKFFITVGNKDTTSRIKIAQEFYNSAKKYGLDVKYKEYDTGHDMVAEQMIDTLDFFRKKIAQRHRNTENDHARIIRKNKLALANSVIYLKNGRKMKGRIIKKSKEKTVLDLGDTYSIGTITLQRKSIKAIEAE